MVVVKGRKCHAYFGGKDGLGMCDTDCQWYQEGVPCVMWVPDPLKALDICTVCKHRTICKIEPVRSRFDNHAIACFDFEEK